MKAEGSSQPANKQANNKMPKPYRFAMFQQLFINRPQQVTGV